jgi:trimeric autotransporter adhesin
MISFPSRPSRVAPTTNPGPKWLRAVALALLVMATPSALRAGGGTLWSSDPAGTDALWSGAFGFPQFDGSVWTAARSGNGVVVGGAFEVAGGVPAHHIARWDGTRWAPLGEGVSSSPQTLLAAGDTVWAAHGATIERWNGRQWASLIAPGTVYSMASQAGILTVLDDGFAGREVSQWDGLEWNRLGPAGLGEAYALSVQGDSIYIGGHFEDGNPTYPTILKVWDGASWSIRATAFQNGALPTVYAIGSYSGQLVMGGEFTSLAYNMGMFNTGTVPVTHIARRVGLAWHAMGQPLPPLVSQITDDGAGHLLICGPQFGTPSGPSYLQWDGTNWIDATNPVTPGMSGVVGVGSGRFVYGDFYADLNQREVHSLARVDAGTANPVPSPDATQDGFGGPTNTGYFGIDAVTGFQGSVVAAGVVSPWGDPQLVYSSRVLVQTAGGSWLPISDPTLLSGTVLTLFSDSSRLIAGGSFSLWSGNQAHFDIAQWDYSPPGSGPIAQWSPMGDFDGAVRAFAMYHGELYAGGDFETADHLLCHHVARWNGSQWLPVGPVAVASDTASYGGVRSLAVWNDRLYAGGSFLEMGGDTTIQNIAAWDGSQWSRVGASLPILPVGALAATSSLLYAAPGLGVTKYPLIPTNQPIQTWDGAVWMPIPTPAHCGVRSLLATSSGLYAGATFDDGAGGWVGLARYSAGEWSTMGSGLRGPADADVAVRTLAILPDGLWAGGSFTVAGGRSSSRIARFDGLASAIPPPGSNEVSLAPTPTAGHVTLRFQIVTPGRVLARVYDITGREVAVAHDASHAAGPVVFDWDASAGTHGALKSGIYLMRIESPGAAPRTARIALVR